jgi:hypothetical protein
MEGHLRTVAWAVTTQGAMSEEVDSVVAVQPMTLLQEAVAGLVAREALLLIQRTTEQINLVLAQPILALGQ